MKYPGSRTWHLHLLGFAVAGIACAGCWGIPSAHTVSRTYDMAGAAVDPPEPCADGRFEDYLTGGRVFQMYCGSCHNARPLGERPFNLSEVSAAHMREQAYLTGKEYRQLIYFLRRWHDVGPPTPDVALSPKRFVFSQPIPELRGQPREPREAATGQPIEQDSLPDNQP